MLELIHAYPYGKLKTLASDISSCFSGVSDCVWARAWRQCLEVKDASVNALEIEWGQGTVFEAALTKL